MLKGKLKNDTGREEKLGKKPHVRRREKLS